MGDGDDADDYDDNHNSDGDDNNDDVLVRMAAIITVMVRRC